MKLDLEHLSARTISLLVLVAVTAAAVAWGRARLDRHKRRAFPELELLPKASDRDAVWHAANAVGNVGRMDRLFLVIGVLVLVCGAGLLRLVEWAIGAGTDVQKLLIEIPCFALAVIGGFWGRFLVQERRIARRIRGELNRRGVPVCVRCGYCLRGAPTPRCSECGEVFDPALLAAHRPADQADGSVSE